MDHNSYVESYTVHCDAKTFSSAFLYSSFTKAKSVEHMTKIWKHFVCTWSHWTILWHTSKLACVVLESRKHKNVPKDLEILKTRNNHISADEPRFHRHSNGSIPIWLLCCWQTAPSNCWGGQESTDHHTNTAPPPLQCWRPAATKPGSNARQSYTLADSSPLFPYPLPLSADATNSSRLVPIARSPARPHALHRCATEISSLGNFRWIHSANFGNHRPWLDYPIWNTVVLPRSARGPRSACGTWPLFKQNSLALWSAFSWATQQTNVLRFYSCQGMLQSVGLIQESRNSLLRLEVLTVVLMIPVTWDMTLCSLDSRHQL